MGKINCFNDLDSADMVFVFDRSVGINVLNSIRSWSKSRSSLKRISPHFETHSYQKCVYYRCNGLSQINTRARTVS